MNLDKIKKKLRREVAAHPAKAAVLGVLCVVALWFWAPLVWGWTVPNKSVIVPAVQPRDEPQLPGFPPPDVAAAGAETEPTERSHSWRELVQWMQNDPRTKPARPTWGAPGPVTTVLGEWLPWRRLSPGGRDPFQTAQSVRRAPVEDTQQESDAELLPVLPAISPKDAGASLTGVVAGLSGGAAIINGRAYMEGDAVLLHKDGKSYTFHLTDVLPGRVVLHRDRMQYELSLPHPANAPSPPRAVSAPGNPP